MSVHLLIFQAPGFRGLPGGLAVEACTNVGKSTRTDSSFWPGSLLISNHNTRNATTFLGCNSLQGPAHRNRHGNDLLTGYLKEASNQTALPTGLVHLAMASVEALLQNSVRLPRCIIGQTCAGNPAAVRLRRPTREAPDFCVLPAAQVAIASELWRSASTRAVRQGDEST
ncbi:hypothetical protein P171DRAFT_5021 [Karstenula rhodostoma CBS 690.94]|uniref:Uncharacterized protein n=1 Tax=Karstenula rhodostoma CBS 690.94 TaxID=1392251 RepID=A0A9P4PW91_9PLEO|nr:hypothetical protein P171DRAFT_5021 [Karstenula rhodostoma CBS 690.94]